MDFTGKHGNIFIMKSLEYFMAQRGTVCELCNIRPAAHRHHCLYHRKKGHPELDEEYNIMIVCVKCHLYDGTPNGYNARIKFWDTQCKRYGKDAMLDWHSRVRLKVKEKGYGF